MSAYWIKPDGDVMKVDSRHIHTIIAYPREFGMTRASIEKAYAKRKEPVGAEGDAREDIMIKLMQKGWIRVRYVPRQDSYTIQLTPAKSPDWQYRTERWAKYMLKKERASEHSQVIILDSTGELLRSSALYEVGSGALQERRKVGTFAAYLNPKKRRSRK